MRESRKRILLCTKIENKTKGRCVFLAIVYMTVKGREWSLRENRDELNVIGVFAEKYKDKEVCIMGDFNSLTGIVDEEINRNWRS